MGHDYPPLCLQLSKPVDKGVLFERGISAHGWVVMRRMSYKLFEAGVQLTVKAYTKVSSLSVSY